MEATENSAAELQVSEVSHLAQAGPHQTSNDVL